MTHELPLMAAYLVGAHFYFDFAGQGDYMAKAKNPWAGAREWPWALFGHAAIHGAAVAAITGSALLGLLEFVTHAALDAMKCSGEITFNQDQWMHLMFKSWWLAFAVMP